MNRATNIRAVFHTAIILVFCIAVWIINEALYTNPSKNERTPGKCEECFTGIEAHGREILYALAYIVVPFAIVLGVLIKGRGKLDGEREDLVVTSEQLQKDALYRYEYNPFHLSRREPGDSIWKNLW